MMKSRIKIKERNIILTLAKKGTIITGTDYWSCKFNQVITHFCGCLIASRLSISYMFDENAYSLHILQYYLIY